MDLEALLDQSALRLPQARLAFLSHDVVERVLLGNRKNIADCLGVPVARLNQLEKDTRGLIETHKLFEAKYNKVSRPNSKKSPKKQKSPGRRSQTRGSAWRSGGAKRVRLLSRTSDDKLDKMCRAT